jgi:hypothetical protein
MEPYTCKESPCTGTRVKFELSMSVFLFVRNMLEAQLGIQYISDIHLEMYRSHDFNPTDFLKTSYGEFLALCGDIGYPEDPLVEEFLRFCSQYYRMVFWVPGNHEFYSPSGQMTLRDKFVKMESLCAKFNNVILMNQTAYNVPGTALRIVGCTLWSDIPEEFKQSAEKYMNDYRLIYKGPGQRLTVNDVIEWHMRDRAWLQSEIQAANDSGRELIVLTHHLPTQRLVHQKYENHPLNVCFSSNLDFMIRYPIRAWLCGHSHTANEARVNNVLCSLNPRGYPGEENSTFDRERTLVVELKDASQPIYPGDTYVEGQETHDSDVSSEEE